MCLMQSVYFTYIVKCIDETYYTGKTKNLDYRLMQHNGLLPGGAKYTTQRKPVNLVYSELFATNKSACRKEILIKRLSRMQKEKLINNK